MSLHPLVVQPTEASDDTVLGGAAGPHMRCTT